MVKLSSPLTREYWEVPVLFEDEHLLALDKPSGLLTSPDRYDPERPNLMKLLHRDVARGASWAQARGLTYLANAHRLDFETSGILLLAKDKPTLIGLANLFGSEKPVKTYVTLVHGQPGEDRFAVARKIGSHPVQVGLMRVDEKRGKKAQTSFHVLERFEHFALVQCQPLTGRTHQIRVHLQAAGFPIVGDGLYGGKPLFLSRLKPGYRAKRDVPEKPLIGRVALHAAELSFPHPANGSRVAIVAPWPKDLTVAVRYLRRFSVMGEQPDQTGAHHNRSQQ